MPVTIKTHLMRGVMERVQKRMEEHAAKHQPMMASVGIHETEGASEKVNYYEKNTPPTVVTVMAIHEFGERPWLSGWFDNEKGRLQSEMFAAYKVGPEAVRSLSTKFRDELRTRLQSGSAGLKALAQVTIEKKTRAGLPKPATPLVATSQFTESIRSQVDGVYT